MIAVFVCKIEIEKVIHMGVIQNRDPVLAA